MLLVKELQPLQLISKSMCIMEYPVVVYHPWVYCSMKYSEEIKLDPWRRNQQVTLSGHVRYLMEKFIRSHISLHFLAFLDDRVRYMFLCAHWYSWVWWGNRGLDCLAELWIINLLNVGKSLDLAGFSIAVFQDYWYKLEGFDEHLCRSFCNDGIFWGSETRGLWMHWTLLSFVRFFKRVKLLRIKDLRPNYITMNGSLWYLISV